MKNINETIMEYFKEWDDLINQIPKDEEILEKKKRELFDLELEEDKKVDYKDLYGYNNDKTRKNHYKKVLSKEFDEIDSIERDIDYDKRRLSFVKTRIKFLLLLKGEMNGEIL